MATYGFMEEVPEPIGLNGERIIRPTGTGTRERNFEAIRGEEFSKYNRLDPLCHKVHRTHEKDMQLPNTKW